VLQLLKSKTNASQVIGTDSLLPGDNSEATPSEKKLASIILPNLRMSKAKTTVPSD